jgi:hypothetical protein
LHASILFAVLDKPRCRIDRLLAAQPQGIGDFATFRLQKAKWQRQVVPNSDSWHDLARLGTESPKNGGNVAMSTDFVALNFARVRDWANRPTLPTRSRIWQSGKVPSGRRGQKAARKR